MLAQVFSGAIYGIDAYPVEVEVDFSQAREINFITVGLPDAAVRESKDRVGSAVSNSGFAIPHGRITINLAPADMKKEGPSFDLPIALGLLSAGRQIPPAAFNEYLITGELALNGAVRPVRGVLPLALLAKKRGLKGIIVPQENADEASVVEDIEVYPVRSLNQAAQFLSGETTIDPVKTDFKELFECSGEYKIDFSDVKGQEHVKRALEVSVAGGHNLLMIGPPGMGKSLLAKTIPSILPPMTMKEALETTKIHSIAGNLDGKNYLVARRPFRSPHHTISFPALVGGGTVPSPGEVSLAHNGILFLDELPEFRRDALESLRQPLENREVTISRSNSSMTFPAGFMLVTAMNPCPCGYSTDPRRECRCTPGQIQKYMAKISGPLLDRIDLHVEVPALDYNELISRKSSEPSSEVSLRVANVREIQRQRFALETIHCNAEMNPRHVKNYCHVDEEGHRILKMAITDLGMSARAFDRILKVSRTIADLDQSRQIKSHHVSEAIQYRTLDRNLWY
jgi:magnesium chelatase family protein